MSEVKWNERKVKDLFSDSNFIGDVLRFTALLEFELDCLLAQYFLREDRIEDGLTFLISSLNFNSKVETLAKLRIRKSIDSFPRAIAGLRRFRKIRNIAAHNWTVSFSDVRNIMGGVEYQKMLLDYPIGLKKEFYETRKCLWRLARVKEFLDVNGKRTVDSGMISLDKYFS